MFDLKPITREVVDEIQKEYDAETDPQLKDWLKVNLDLLVSLYEHSVNFEKETANKEVAHCPSCGITTIDGVAPFGHYDTCLEMQQIGR